MNFNNPQMGMMGGSGLQYNPTGPMWPYINVTPNNLPFIPNVNTDQRIKQYLPLIVSAAISEIQTKAQTNPLRMYMFNMFGANNFRTAEFSELIQLICDLMFARAMQSNGNVDFNRLIGSTVGECCQGFACAVLSNFPAIQQYLNPQQTQVAIQGAQAIQQLNMQVQQFQQQLMQQQNGFGFGQQMPMNQPFAFNQQQAPALGGGFNWQNNGGPSSSFGGGMDTTMKTRWDKIPQHSRDNLNTNQIRQNSSPTPWDRGIVRNNGFNREAVIETAASSWSAVDAPNHQWNSTQPQQPQKMRNWREVAMEDNSVQPQSFRQQGSQFQQHQQVEEWQQPTQEPVESKIEIGKLYEVGELTWTSSARQPYPPAYDPRTHRPFMRMEEDGVVIMVLKQIKEGEQMDPDKHQIGRRYTNNNRFVGTKKTAQNEEVVVNYEEPEIDGFSLKIDENIPITHSEESAQFETRIDSLTKGYLDHIDAAALTNVVIHTPITASVCSMNLVKSIMQSVLNWQKAILRFSRA